MSNPSITADKTPWYQWDTGLTVTVSGGTMNECHFANRKQGTAYVQAVINGIARVPDELLQVASPIKAYGYVSDGAGGQTYVEETFEVIARNIPADYTYTKTAQKTIRDAEVARDEAVKAAKDAKTSALDADDSAIEASKSAQSAGESASAAATSASNAAKSAGDAAKSASDAKDAAGKAVEDASELLKTYTDDAKTSADNAATSARNAADAANAASGSASAAEQSATDASNAKVAAQTAKDEVEAAKSEAATSASNAATSATAAAKSASDAAASVNSINAIAPKSVDIAPTIVGGDSLAIGRGAKASDKGNYSVVIGSSAHAHAIGTVAIGSGAVDAIDTKGQNVIIGDNAQVNGAVAGSIVLGSYSIATKDAEMSIGNPATDTGIAETTREITHVSDPTAPTSASTKKYTDDNDAKTLTEAKKYTDDNTNNALIGKVSGKLLHVDDAWPSSLLSIEIEGATEQVTTTGKNLLNPDPLKDISNFDRSQYNIGFYVYKFVTPSTGDYTVSVKQSVKDTNYLMISNSPTFGSGKQVWISHPSVALKTRATFNGVSAIYLYFSSDIAKVQDTLAKVGGIQIETGTTPTAYEPYTGGKPSPSPDYPQEIKVIENPIVKVTGRNLLDFAFPAQHASYASSIARINPWDVDNPKVTLPFTSVSSSEGFGFVCRLAAGRTYTIKAFNLEVGKHAVFVAGYVDKADVTDNNKAVWYKSDTSLGSPVSFTVQDGGEWVVFCFAAIWDDGTNKVTYPADFKASVECGGTVADFVPYTAKSIAITLPAEHPYIAKLPDGTHDEIVIDKEGNASLVARVSKTETAAADGVSATVGTDALSSTGALDDGATVYYKIATPITYPLGKLDIPSLPETISNVWTDAELTTNMSMTYKRDINIAFDNLVQAVVAAAAGE